MSRILIADDEPSVREVIAVLLEDEGHTVQTAPDGRVALQLITDERPDLLITDVMMPHLDGWALLNAVRDHAPTLPAIVISAVAATTRQRVEFSPDHTVFLRKPFDLEALLTTVERLMGSSPS